MNYCFFKTLKTSGGIIDINIHNNTINLHTLGEYSGYCFNFNTRSCSVRKFSTVLLFFIS